MTQRPRRRAATAVRVIEKPTMATGPDRRIAVLIAACLVLGIALFVLAYRQQDVPLAGIDAEDYAEIGRQIATGRGMTALFMPLNGLAFLQDRGLSLVPPWPNISRFPLPPVVMAATFAVAGTSDVAVAVYSLIGYLAVVPFAVLIGKRLGGWPLAIFSGTMVLLHPDALQLAFSGLTEPASGAVLIAVAWLVLRKDWRSHLIAGLVLGLGFYNRSTLLALVVPAAIAVWYTANRRRESTLALVGGAVGLALPWLVWMTVLTGSPVFNLQNASVLTLGTDTANPDFGWYQYQYRAAAPDLGATIGKWTREAFTVYELFPAVLGPWYLLAFAVVGWVLCPREYWTLRYLIVGWLVLQVAIYSFAGNISRFYTIFQPLVTIFAGLGILALASRVFDRGASVALALLALLVAIPSGAAILGIKNFEGSPTRSDVFSAIVDVSLENGPYIASKTARNDLVLSNVPWSVAWRAARPSAPIPPRPGDIEAFEQRSGLRVAAVYLTPQLYIVGVPASWSEWRELRGQARPIAGFTIDRRFRDGSILYLRQ